MAFCRPYFIKIIAPREGYANESKASLQSTNFRRFLTFAAILVFLHHFMLFFVEAFRFREFFMTLLRVILSSICTMILIVISQYLFNSNKSKA
jgi:hypothetical protein